MIAPEGLQVAVDEGDDFVLAGQSDLLALVVLGLQHRPFEGVEFAGVDAVVDDRDFVVVGLGHRGVLPTRGADALVHLRQVHEVVGVFGPEAAAVGQPW